MTDLEALRLHVRGVVQGVGFRPFVHRLAIRHRLGGRVRNESGSVFIEVEGAPAELRAFLEALRSEAPPLARIDELEVTPEPPRHRGEFEVARSEGRSDRRLPVSPDVALCSACEAELLDPANRRHGYPFITCTDCGPRYTVIESMPYDRERTSMRAFRQCPECLAEYRDPGDRRYHSQTNACAGCGPGIRVEKPTGGRVAGGGDAVAEAARALMAGNVVAVRGLGGFHLACDATDEAAVRRLRDRKGREVKPLAVMVATPEEAREIGRVGDAEARLLASRERPIVLLRARDGSALAASVAPGLDTVGVMAAYTPLHRLLLERVGRPLVMTSGNRSEEPIATGNEEGRERLAGIADLFLLHDREIVSRYDDSVVRVVEGEPVFLRRARGYAPLPVDLPLAAPVPLLAVGPHLKNTFALVHGRAAYVSQHIGDLENLETLDHFTDTLDRYRELFHIDPAAVVRDRHPGYLSSRLAEELGIEPLLAVQHHHAHVAAVAAEHGVTDPVIGVAYDGTGMGEDGKVWGAEILVADLRSFRRAAHLRYAPLPGSDLAVRRPWRAALGYLSLDPAAAPAFRRAFLGVPDRDREVAERQALRRLNAPEASSMGRLFDAAAAVLGVRLEARYEGQAAMELEALAGEVPAEPLPLPLSRGGEGTWILDPLPLLSALGERLAAGEDGALLAARFHEGVAAATAEVVTRVAGETGIGTAALGGGCFQNARLLASVRRRLEAAGVRVLVPRRLGPNDGAISYGQAAVAAAILRDGGR